LEAFKAKAMTVLDEAYGQGVRYFDTAPGYGLAEKWLIEWLGNQNDHTIELATKWGYTYVANFDPAAAVHEVKEHSLRKLNEQWEQSQHLLPYLTTYQIHSATLETGVLRNTEILNRLADLRDQHDLRIGLTASGENQCAILEEALSIEIGGRALFEAYQVTYNILDQSVGALAKQLSGQGKRLIIKEALANGRLFPNPGFPHYQQLYDVLSGLAEKYQVGIDAVALRFCVDALAPDKVLSGAAVPEHLTANLKVQSFGLTASELATLTAFVIPAKVYWHERKTLNWN
jgi:aryl-alcohol dehydrogenase-like predicted oxidoreductase